LQVCSGKAGNVDSIAYYSLVPVWLLAEDLDDCGQVHFLSKLEECPGAPLVRIRGHTFTLIFRGLTHA